jgi:hypothetical protein
MATIYDNINNLYDKAGYLQRYGSDLYITIVVVLIAFIAISYFKVMSTIKPIKADWVRQRCNPSVIPFAGLIYRPEGKTVMEATNDNLVQCSQTTLQNVSGYALQPFMYMVSVITEMFSAMQTAIQSIRAKINEVRGSVSDVGQDVMGRTLNVMSPLQQMLVASKSAFGKTAGIGASSIYTLYGGYLALKSLIGSIIQFIIIILVGLAAAVIILWILPFTWPIAAIGTAVFVAFAVLLSILIVAFSRSMHGSSGQVPSKPGCFDGETPVQFKDGSVKPIASVTPDDYGKSLKDGSILIGLVQSSALGHDLFNYNGTFVTGSHRVIVPVSELHGEERHIAIGSLGLPPIKYDKDVVYCPITSTGHFFIGSDKFADWLDLSVEESEFAYKWFDVDSSRRSIINAVCGGLKADSSLGTDIGVSIPITSVKLHVPLRAGVIPLAKVSMLSSQRWNKVVYENGEHITKSGVVEVMSWDHKFGEETFDAENRDVMYHLVTNKGYFYVGSNKVYDFDQVLDNALKCRQ